MAVDQTNLERWRVAQTQLESSQLLNRLAGFGSPGSTGVPRLGEDGATDNGKRYPREGLEGPLAWVLPHEAEYESLWLAIRLVAPISA